MRPVPTAVFETHEPCRSMRDAPRCGLPCQGNRIGPSSPLPCGNDSLHIGRENQACLSGFPALYRPCRHSGTHRIWQISPDVVSLSDQHLRTNLPTTLVPSSSPFANYSLVAKSLDPSAATVSKMSLHGGSCSTGFATRPGISDVQFRRILLCLQEECLIDKFANQLRISIRRITGSTALKLSGKQRSLVIPPCGVQM